jgi:rfaE bifunctional protein nucleotidyltransferase chain/domain
VTTVLASGVFEVLHAGHIAYLTECRKYGDRLIVAVTADEYVRRGPGRPMFPAEARANALASLRMVDEVRIVGSASVVPVIRELQPQVYAKGNEYGTLDLAGNLEAERSAVAEYGGSFVLADTMRGSSTRWLNQHAPNWPQHAAEWIASVHASFSLAEVVAWFDLVSKLVVEVYGEPIVDEYVYVEPLGKSAKETLISFAPDGTDSWEGGAAIVAAHLTSYCGKVRYRDAGTAPVVKRRYVERAFTHKVFQTVQPQTVRAAYQKPGACDVVVAADFGHGLFWPGHPLADDARWLAITCQSNSANWGFNPVTKWARANYVVAAEAWNHHNCLHNEKLVCIGGIGGSEHQAVYPECGRVWVFDDAGHDGGTR